MSRPIDPTDMEYMDKAAIDRMERAVGCDVQHVMQLFIRHSCRNAPGRREGMLAAGGRALASIGLAMIGASYGVECPERRSRMAEEEICLFERRFL